MQQDNSLIKNLKQKATLLKKEIYSLYLAYRHPLTPWYAKLFALMVIAYALSPIDLIPDFIPVLGHLDDLLLVPLGIMLALKMIPADIMEGCRQQAEGDIDLGGALKMIPVVLIVLAWLAIIFVIVRWIINQI